MGAEGVLWGQVSSPTLTRYHGDGSGNALYSPANEATATSYFSAMSPWGLMGRVSMRPDGSVASRCNIGQTSLQVAANGGDRCYSDTNIDANGEQKMVYVPQFCYYCDYVAAHNIVWWVGQIGDSFTPQAADGTFTGTPYTFSASDIHPAFLVDGVAKSGAFISAYEGSYNTNFMNKGVTALESVSGAVPKVSITKPNLRTPAENIGTGWELMTTQINAALQYLFIIEYGSLNGQTTLGAGNTGAAATITNTGGTALSGNASYGSSSTVSPISYRGIENWWGNIATFIEGVRTDASYHIWIQPQTRLHTYNDSSTLSSQAYYVDSTSTFPSTTGMQYMLSCYTTTGATGLGWAFLPSAIGALSNTYFCDVVAGAAFAYVQTIGGWVTDGLACGPFAMNHPQLYTGTVVYVGGRIQYLPS